MGSIYLQSPGAEFFRWGPISIRWYGVMIAAGFLASLYFALRLSERWGLDKDKLINAALIAFLGGLVGARLYFVALNIDAFVHRPEDILAVWQGGMSIHGGILGGLVAGVVYARLARFPIASGCDVFGVVLPLGQAIGRWGNFFNSEAFGRPVFHDFPIKLFIPETHRPLHFQMHEYFHPTFLYESLWDLVIFALLFYWLADRLKAYPGATFMVYLAAYSLGRLVIEPLRIDSIMIGHLPAPTVASAVSLVLALIGFALAVSRARRQGELHRQ